MPARKWSTAQVVLPFAAEPESLPSARQYRSTWIVSSLQALRGAGYFPAYLGALRAQAGAREIEERILNCVAGEWLPLPIAHLHYEACNSLALSEGSVLDMAREGAGADVRRTWHAQFVGSAKRETATPWTVLPQLHKLWERTADGGAAAVYRLADNEAVVQYVGCGLFAIRHFRHAVRAVLCVLGDHVCEDLQTVTLPQDQPTGCAFHLRWRA